MSPAITTKDLILDTAESLFSKHGIDGVSLRLLTKHAGVNLGSVHYHFGSKEAVVRAVFSRRVRPVNRERIEMLDDMELRGRPDVEAILTALFAPVIRMAGDSNRGRRCMRLGARFYSEPADYLATMFEQEFAEVFRRFDAAIRRALPAIPPPVLRQRIHFAVGVMVHTMLDSDRRPRLKACESVRPTAQETLEAMVRFVAAGMRAPAPGDPTRPNDKTVPERSQ